MKAHELARRLLEGPDLPVVYQGVAGDIDVDAAAVDRADDDAAAAEVVLLRGCAPGAVPPRFVACAAPPDSDLPAACAYCAAALPPGPASSCGSCGAAFVGPLGPETTLRELGHAAGVLLRQTGECAGIVATIGRTRGGHHAAVVELLAGDGRVLRAVGVALDEEDPPDDRPSVQGIPARLMDELQRQAGEHLDAYSAVCRPGSWEWQLPQAQHLRERLAAEGYAAAKDPQAAWRVRWTRAEA